MKNKLKEIALNQLILNTWKPTGLTPLELREKLLKLKNKKIWEQEV